MPAAVAIEYAGTPSLAIPHLLPSVHRPPREDACPARRRTLSVVVCAYNEERNLPRLLEALLDCHGPSFELLEVLLVASGCTDGTVSVARHYAARDPRVRLLVSPDRAGKATALQAGLAAARGDLIVVENADTVPLPDTPERLVAPFAAEDVMLVCARPLPVPAGRCLTARLAATLWEVHHAISSESPKAGEAYAVRAGAYAIPPDVGDDDTYLGETARRRGAAIYADRALVFNRVPTIPSELVRQRWRVNRQVVGLWRRTGLRSSSWRVGVLVPALIAVLRDRPRRLGTLGALAVCEGVLRLLALGASFTGRATPRAWSSLESTKPAIDVPISAAGPTRPGRNLRGGRPVATARP